MSIGCLAMIDSSGRFARHPSHVTACPITLKLQLLKKTEWICINIGVGGYSGQKLDKSTYYPKYEIFTKNKLIKI